MMKTGALLIALLIGGLLGFGLTKYFSSTVHLTNPVSRSADGKAKTSEWNWPDSLDAVKAAPNNHKVVYEDSTVRILQVL